MKSFLLFSSVGLIVVSLFLDLDKESLYICWGIGAFLFALVFPKLIFGIGILVGGSLLAIRVFNSGNDTLGFIIIAITCVVGGYFLIKSHDTEKG